MRREFPDPTDADIRDLADFCVRWPVLKGTVNEHALEGAAVPAQSRATIAWLVSLADAVCRGVEPGDHPLADPRDRFPG